MRDILPHLSYNKLFLLNNRQKTNHLHSHSPMCFIDPKTLLGMSGNVLNEFSVLFINFFFSKCFLKNFLHRSEISVKCYIFFYLFITSNSPM